MTILKTAFCAVVILVAFQSAPAQMNTTISGNKRPCGRFPDRSGYMNDPAQMLPPDLVNNLNDSLEQFYEGYHVELIVVVQNPLDLSERCRKNYITTLKAAWHIGRRKPGVILPLFLPTGYSNTAHDGIFSTEPDFSFFSTTPIEDPEGYALRELVLSPIEDRMNELIIVERNISLTPTLARK